MNNVYLVGFMGTGKSSIGKAFARSSKRTHLDLDAMLVKRAGMPITEIFARNGEPHFRALESGVLQEAARHDRAVVSCGGGIVTDPANVDLMKQTGVMICLTSRPEVILRRTSGSGHRPLLNVPDPRAKIEELLKQRAPLYARADHTIDTSDLTVSGAAEKLAELGV